MNSLKYILTSTAIAFFLQPTFMQESALAMDGWDSNANNRTTKKPQKAVGTEPSWEEEVFAAEAAHWGGKPEEARKHFLLALIKSPDASRISLRTQPTRVYLPERDDIVVAVKTLSPESVDAFLCNKSIKVIFQKDVMLSYPFKITLDTFLLAFHKYPASPFDFYVKDMLALDEVYLEYYEEALKKFPDSPILYISAGKAACSLDKLEDAFRYYSMALQKNPDSPWIDYYRAGKMAADLKKHEASFHYLDIALKGAPEPDWKDYDTIGKAAHALGKDAEALYYFQKAFKTNVVQKLKDKEKKAIEDQQALEKSNRAIKLQQIVARKLKTAGALQSLEEKIAQAREDKRKADIVTQKREDQEKVDIEFLKLKVALLQDPDSKEKFFQEWVHFFEHNSNQETTLLRANVVINCHEEIGLFELHPFIQAALRAGLLAETSEDPLNPYNFHKNLLKKREQQIDWSQINPVKETINGYEIQLNPEFFQKQLIEFVPFKALPSYNSSLLKSMIGRFNERVENNPKINQYIQGVTGLSYEQLKEESIIKGRLHSRLAYKGDLEEAVPLTQIRLIALINFIASLSNEIETQDSLLSKQEENLIRSLAAIQGCSTGIEEGIQAAYLYYVPMPKKTLTKDQEEDLRDIVSAMLPVIEKQFSGNNHFAKKVIGMNSKEEVQQASHNGRCLRNLIGDKVGLQGIKFDTGTQVLYKEIVEKTSQEVLQVFYQYLLPTEIVAAVGQRASFEDEDAIELLEKMGVMKILSRPQ